MVLAKKRNLSRTGLSWFFADLNAMHVAMIDRWENKNTGNLAARCNGPAPNICTGFLNLIDWWLDPSLFDARLGAGDPQLAPCRQLSSG
ncbi:hypothetical protein [Litoreibacter albidus]|uniref:hypothetical protein n=1 Tax=Litoreibacter albidus TaxID=670155 RepID=UPI003734CE7E